MVPDSAKTAIIGAGNILMGDDGIGVMAARRIAEELKSDALCLHTKKDPHCKRTDVQNPDIGDLVVIEAGTDTDIVFDALMRYGYTIILDAIAFGKAPATLYRIPFEKILAWNENADFSLHERGCMAALKMAYLAGRKARGFILGVEPEKVSPCVGLSPAVAGAVPKLIKKVLILNG